MDNKKSPEYIKALEYHQKGQPGKIALKAMFEHVLNLMSVS